MLVEFFPSLSSFELNQIFKLLVTDRGEHINNPLSTASVNVLELWEEFVNVGPVDDKLDEVLQVKAFDLRSVAFHHLLSGNEFLFSVENLVHEVP